MDFSPANIADNSPPWPSVWPSLPISLLGGQGSLLTLLAPSTAWHRPQELHKPCRLAGSLRHLPWLASGFFLRNTSHQKGLWEACSRREPREKCQSLGEGGLFTGKYLRRARVVMCCQKMTWDDSILHNPEKLRPLLYFQFQPGYPGPVLS